MLIAHYPFICCLFGCDDDLWEVWFSMAYSCGFLFSVINLLCGLICFVFGKRCRKHANECDSLCICYVIRCYV